MVARVSVSIQREILLLDQSRPNKPTEDVRAASIIVGTAGARTAEGLLLGDRALV